MNNKHQKTLQAIFKNPVSGSVVWTDVEALFVTLGAEVSEGNGSRIRVLFKGVAQVFHRPHPKKETDKGAVKAVRGFLKRAGVKPDA